MCIYRVQSPFWKEIRVISNNGRFPLIPLPPPHWRMALGTWGGVFCGRKMPCVTQVLSVEQRLDKFRLQIPICVKYDFFLNQKNRLYLYFRGVNRKACQFYSFPWLHSFFFFFHFHSFSLDEKRGVLYWYNAWEGFVSLILLGSAAAYAYNVPCLCWRNVLGYGLLTIDRTCFKSTMCFTENNFSF